MKRYDYITGIVNDDRDKPLSVLIAKRANEGWRLVSCQFIEPEVYFLVMEREAQPTT